MKVNLLRLRLSNAYLIIGDRPILVDSGTAGDSARIRSKLREFNVEFSDLALIIHTHVHSDHIGSTAEIVAEAKCPVAYHPADQSIADQANNGKLNGVGLRGSIMSRFFSGAAFTPVKSDVPVYDGMKLNEYGAEGVIVETPGHTAGSISIIGGDGSAIIGDVIMGGYLGGNLLPGRPNFHYFADDLQQAMRSLDKIISCTTRKFYVGHGGPLSHNSVVSWRKRIRY